MKLVFERRKYFIVVALIIVLAQIRCGATEWGRDISPVRSPNKKKPGSGIFTLTSQFKDDEHDPVEKPRQNNFNVAVHHSAGI
jgi:hypothetical protein